MPRSVSSRMVILGIGLLNANMQLALTSRCSPATASASLRPDHPPPGGSGLLAILRRLRKILPLDIVWHIRQCRTPKWHRHSVSGWFYTAAFANE